MASSSAQFRNPPGSGAAGQSAAVRWANETARSQKILNSWKEIARYMGRGVRTVQRWEHDLGLPVHRPKGKDRSSVVALAHELDDWLQRTPVFSRGNNGGLGPEISAVLLDLARDLLSQCERLAGLHPQRRPETEELVKAVREIEHELVQVRNITPAARSRLAASQDS